MRRLFAPVVIGVLAAAAYYAANESGVNIGMIAVDEFYGEQFYAVIATLYAIITALLLVKGIETFNALGGSINSEAMKLRSINAYFVYFNDHEQADGGDSIRRIRSQLVAYVDNVLELKRISRSNKNDRVIDDCIQLCAKITIADDNDRVAISEIMRGLDELRALRAQRISCAREKIPDYLIRMLALMTAAIMLPFYFHHEPAIGFNYYIIFTLGVFGSFIYFLLNDINRPYEGLWRIDTSPYEAAREEIVADR